MTTDGFVVTDGLRRYRVQRPWGRLPPGLELEPLSQLAVDSRGRVYALRRARPFIVVFAPDGTVERTLDHARLTSAHGICITPDGRLFVTTFDAHQVLGFDRDGTLYLELGGRDEPRWNAPFNHPTDVAVAANGDIYVSDGYGNALVHRFAADGTLIRSWGRPGCGPGEFGVPHAVWVTASGSVLVADRENDRVQVFGPDGEYRDAWRGFYRPMDIWGDGHGRLYVTEQTPRITCLDEAGMILGRGRTFGKYPHGIWGDSEGNLWLAEMEPTSITKLACLPNDGSP